MASRTESAGTGDMNGDTPSDTQNGKQDGMQDGTQPQRRTMSYISLFSGIEAASVAWEPLGWKPLCFSEIDEFPSAVLAARYPDVPNLGDIKNVDWQNAMGKYGKPDVVIGGSPCFPAGALVMTEHGFKPIEDIVPGDMVVTYKGRLRRVTNVGRKTADTIILKGLGIEYGIECTPNHPFLSCKDEHGTASTDRTDGSRDDVPKPDATLEWVRADEMNGRRWFNVSTIHGTDAQLHDDDANGARIRPNALTIETCHAIGALFAGHDTVADDGIEPCDVIGTSSQGVRNSLEDDCSTYMHDDSILTLALSMPAAFREAMLHGYEDGSTSYDGTRMTATTSRAIALGMKAIAGSLGIAIGIRRRDGQNGEPDEYVIDWNAYDDAIIGDGGWFGKVKSVTRGRNDVTVYNLEVEEDHSYTVDGIAVHNCQSFSVAGKREGLSGASGLMYEYIRAIQEIRPRNVIFENVPGAFSSEHGQAFRQLLSSLDDLGYGLAWRVLDSEFWGVAQRRRRVFLVGCLGDPERAAKVLFDDPSLYRDPEPSRVKRQEIAGRAGDRAQGTDKEGDDTNAEPADVIALQSDGSTSLRGNGAGWNDTGAAYTLNTLDKQSVAYRMIAINQRNEARYDGGDGQTVGAIPARPGGKQMQCVIEARGSGTDPDVIGALCASDAKQIGNQYVSQGKVIIETRHADSDMQHADETTGDTPRDGMQAQRDAHSSQGVTMTQGIPQDDTQGTGTAPSGQDADGMRHSATSAAVRAAECAIIMASGQSHAERLVGMSPTLVARQYKDPPILFMPDTDATVNDADGTQDASQGVTYVVRRLMPIETERLQGFPDDWTDLTGEDADRIASILLNGPFATYDERHATTLKRNVRRWCTDCPDGKRYKATGNSMAVPVIRWLGERIAETASE